MTKLTDLQLKVKRKNMIKSSVTLRTHMFKTALELEQKQFRGCKKLKFKGRKHNM